MVEVVGIAQEREVPERPARGQRQVVHAAAHGHRPVEECQSPGGHDAPDDAVLLVEEVHVAGGVRAVAQVAARGGRVRLFDEVEERSLRAAEAQPQLGDAARPAVRQVVGVEGVRHAVDEVAEDQPAVERRNARVAEHGAGRDGVARAAVMLVLGDGVGEARRRGVAAGVRAVGAVAVEDVGTFTLVPTVVGSGHAQVDLLDEVLADVGDEHPPVGAIPHVALRVAEAGGELLGQERRLAGVVRVVGGDAVLAVGARVRRAAGGGERIDAQDRAVRLVQGLGEVERVAAAAAVAGAEIEVAALGGRGGRRVEGDEAGVVVAVGPGDAQNFAVGRGGVGGGEGARGRVGNGPFVEHLVVVARAVTGHEGRRLGRVRLAAHRVELPVAGRPGVVEVRVEREALEATFAVI